VFGNKHKMLYSIELSEEGKLFTHMLKKKASVFLT
jgi:hypothetical protein